MKLAGIFTDHMVMQANQPIRIFGEGKGSVKIRFLDEYKEFISDSDEWYIELQPRPYGGFYKMEISLNKKNIPLCG